MRAVFMMVTNILGEQSLQLAFIQRNNVVQQVSSRAKQANHRSETETDKAQRLKL